MKTAVVFEGGGMRGIFCAGVIDYLIDQNILFDSVYGVSAGACHAVSYCSGQRGRAFRTAVEFLDDPRYCSLTSLRKTGELFGSEFLYHTIPEELDPVDEEQFQKRGMIFKVVMTNCITGEAEYPRIRSLKTDMEYVRASSSLPLLARMVPLNGYVYMDGGLTDSIPVRKAEEDGNEKIVAVLTRPRDYVKHTDMNIPAVRMKYRKYPKMVEALEQRHIVYNETREHIAERVASGSMFVIEPMGSLHIGKAEKNRKKLEQAYWEGYYVAEGLGDRLKKFLSE
ncbi:MAG: patatin-like phospholipase family protein [Anaerovoracaceae bacterium]|jgi:predicted patatin/cPLA2 family phospholipase